MMPKSHHCGILAFLIRLLNTLLNVTTMVKYYQLIMILNAGIMDEELDNGEKMHDLSSPASALESA